MARIGVRTASRLAVLVAAALLCWAAAAPIMWSGGVTSSSAQLRLQVTATDGDTIVVSTSRDLSAPVWTKVVATGMQAGNPTALSPSTRYYYGLQKQAASDPSLVGTFMTHTVANVAASYSIAFGSCAFTGYESGVFTAIADLDPLFFIHMGDLHYEDIDNDDVTTRDDSYYNVFDSDTQADLYRRVPLVYMWDDHDYGPNNADGTFIGKRVARLAYQQFFPHYPLAAGSGNVPIQQAFTVGRVRFIITDLRSEASMPYSPNSTMGYPQRRWFLEELSQYKNYGMIVWVNTKPWMGPAEEGVDRWPGFAAERQYISDQIVAMGVNNLVSLSGDAHLIAIDSGAHMDYSSSGGAGFPVFHAAPMAQYGSSKDVGPFTEGCQSYRFYMNHHYGTMDITDDGTTVCMDWKGFRFGDDDVLMQYKACTPTVVSGVGGGATCGISLFPVWVMATMAVLALAVLQLLICCCCLRRMRRTAQQRASKYEPLPVAADDASLAAEMTPADSWPRNGAPHVDRVTKNPLRAHPRNNAM